VTAPAQRRIQPAGELLCVLIRFVDLEIGGARIVEDQIDIETEQVGGPKENLPLNLFRPDRQEVERPIEPIDREPARLRQPSDLRQPALGAGQL
jgi:hypothetical protein